MTYTFSFWKNTQGYEVKRRPWWAFWRHDEVVPAAIHKRHAYTVSGYEAEILKIYANNNWENVEAKLLLKLLDNPTNLMLEANVGVGNVTPSEYVSEPTRTNELRHSRSGSENFEKGNW